MTKLWTSVRLRRSTLTALQARLARLEAQRQKGHGALQKECPMTLDEMVWWLLRHVANDDRRKLESRKRIAARRSDAQQQVLAPNGGQQ